MFVSNTTIIDTTVLGDLTEAAWGAYAQQLVGTMGAAAIVAGRAQAVPLAAPVFSGDPTNPETIYGWFLVDPTQAYLIAAANIGSTVIPAGLTFVLSAAITDDEA